MQTVKTALSASVIDGDRDADKQFVIRPANRDLFVRTGEQVIDSCQLGISVELWFAEAQSMIERVRAWADERPEQVRSCYCAAGGKRIDLFVVPAKGKFDFDLADDLVELNTALIKDFNVGRVEVGQVPWGELARFVDVNSSIHVSGEAHGDETNRSRSAPDPNGGTTVTCWATCPRVARIGS